MKESKLEHGDYLTATEVLELLSHQYAWQEFPQLYHKILDVQYEAVLGCYHSPSNI